MVVADEGQRPNQEEPTRAAGAVEMRRGWWEDESKHVGGGRVETSCFVTHLPGRNGHGAAQHQLRQHWLNPSFQSQARSAPAGAPESRGALG